MFSEAADYPWRQLQTQEMEISDEVPGGTRDKTSRERIRAVFQQLLGLVHIALVEHYEISDIEAFELEKDLYLSFHQYCRQQPEVSVQKDAQFLLVMTCQLGREYQRYKLDGGFLVPSARLTGMLGREPQDVARDFSKSLDLLRYRYPHA